MQRLFIAGNVGKDAELRHTQGGDAVLGFPIAVDNGKDKPATWYDATIWGKRASSLETHIKKGTKLALVGRPTVRVHNDKAYLGISVDDLTFMGGAKRDDGGYQQDQRQDQRQEHNQSRDDLDDSIPF